MNNVIEVFVQKVKSRGFSLKEGCDYRVISDNEKFFTPYKLPRPIKDIYLVSNGFEYEDNVLYNYNLLPFESVIEEYESLVSLFKENKMVWPNYLLPIGEYNGAYLLCRMLTNDGSDSSVFYFDIASGSLELEIVSRSLNELIEFVISSDSIDEFEDKMKHHRVEIKKIGYENIYIDN